METLFTLLFKYRPFVFGEGKLGFSLPAAPWILLTIFVLVTVTVVWLSRRLFAQHERAWILFAVRLAVCLSLLVLLMRPTLTLSRTTPQTGILAFLIDNSRSMGLGSEGTPRAEGVPALADPAGDLSSTLHRDFQLRWLKFDRTPERLENPSELNWSGDQTNLTGALRQLLNETRNLPLAGVVLVTDGADNGFRDLQSVVGEYSARKIPIHTVGVGPTILRRDLELLEVSLPKRTLPGSVVVGRVSIRHPGFEGGEVQLNVRDGSTLLDSRRVSLSRESQVTTAEFRVAPRYEGVKILDVTVERMPGEEVEENNSRKVLLEVRASNTRVLLVEGRPRWEYKFVRQALSEDKSLRLESLLRTALNKFYRQGIEEESTLSSGFPASRSELFQYKGLVLGDVESAFFTYPQMETIRDFVSRRGGGLLMLGGGSTLSAGGYQNTPIEEVLPVWLEKDTGGRGSEIDYLRADSKVELTAFGKNHPALQIAPSETESIATWNDMPPLIDRNLVSGLKPGATLLMQASSDGGPKAPLLVSHRYGRGMGLAFLSGSSWRWQMLRDHEDRSHETFWQQVLRWLVSSAKDPVSVELERQIYSQNEPVKIRAEINDDSFNRLNDARVEVRIIPPAGEPRLVQLEWNPAENGIYEATFSPSENGLFRIDATAWQAQRGAAEPVELGTDAVYFECETGWREYFDSTQKEDFLRGISAATGGRYYTLADVGTLPEEVVYSGGQTSTVEVLDLWNMPVNFLLLLGLLSAEWIVRRRWGWI
jgi:uncharacterized membrane protein